jgi:hypothetical protein
VFEKRHLERGLVLGNLNLLKWKGRGCRLELFEFSDEDTGNLIVTSPGTYSVDRVSERDGLEDGTGSRGRNREGHGPRIRGGSLTYPEDPWPTTDKGLRSAGRLFNGSASRETKHGAEVGSVNSIYNFFILLLSLRYNRTSAFKLIPPWILGSCLKLLKIYLPGYCNEDNVRAD